MSEDIKVASIYAEVDFRLSAQTMNNLNRFEKRLDTVRRKLANLSTTKFNINAQVHGGVGGGARGASGGAAFGMAGMLSGGNMMKLAQDIRYREAVIKNKFNTLENKIRATDLVPQELITKTREDFNKLADAFRLDKLMKIEFEGASRELARYLADAQKKERDALRPTKFSKEINAGAITQLARIAKAKEQMDRNIEVKRDQFERAATNLGNLTPAQISQYRARLHNLIKEYESAPWAVNKFRTSVSMLDREMRKANKTTTFFTRQLKYLKDYAKMAEMAVIPVIGGMAAGIFSVGRRMDKINTLFYSAFGKNAQSEMEYLRGESDRLGVSLMQNAGAYAKIAFSLKLLNLHGDQARKVFSSFSEASLAFGMSQEDLAHAFLAIEQMYSKGNVQAQELRNQLGNAGIPGVFEIAAQSMNMTPQQLDKAVQARQISAEKLIMALSDALHVLAAPGVKRGMKTIEPTLNRFNLSLQWISDEIYQDLLPGMKDFIDSFRNIIDGLEPIIMPVVDVFGRLFNIIGSIFKVATSVFYDITHLDKIFGLGWMNWKPFNNNTTVTKETKATITIQPSEQAKKDLDIKIEKSHKDFWDGISLSIAK